MKKFGNLLWGIVLITLGVIIAVNTLGIAKINIFFEGWWTFFIIIPCFISLIKGPSRMGNLIGLIIGIALFLCAQGMITFSIIRKLTIPFIFIMIGLGLIFRDFFYGKVNEKIKMLSKSGLKEYTATFGGSKIDMANEVFEGADLTAVFGGVELNLVNSILKEEQVINSTAVFGGITIKVPENVNIQVKSTSIFGGVENKIKTTSKQKENVPTIYVNALCMFGGVEIK